MEGTENKEDKHRLGEAHAMEERKPVEKAITFRKMAREGVAVSLSKTLKEAKA